MYSLSAPVTGEKHTMGLLAFVAMIVIAVTITGSPTKQGKHDELAGGTQVVKG